MKQGNTKQRSSIKASVQTGRYVKKAASNRSTVARQSLNTANYANVISYIVKTEEDETGMMVTSSRNVSTD